MAAIKISSIKTSAYMSMEQRTNPIASSNHLSGSILAYPNKNQNNGHLISGQIVPNQINSLPKAKIRIQKKSHQNKPLVNLNENLFTRNDNNYITTKSIVDESGKIERNYSYIEAMKEDIPSFHIEPQQKPPTTPHKTNKKGDTLPLNNSNKLEYSLTNNKGHQNGFNLCSETKKKPAMSIPSSSPSMSSPASSTKSSTISHKYRAANPEVSPKNVTPSKHNTSNLSKSASQSSILTIFKNTFSPFAIRKWRSKSRDKIIHKTELTTCDAVDGNNYYINNKPPAKPRAISPEMSNQQKNVYHKSIKNSHFMQQELLTVSSATVEPTSTLEPGQKYQKNQLTPNQIKLRTVKTKESSTTNIFIDNSNYDNSIRAPNDTAYENGYLKESMAPSESPRSFFTNTTTKSKTTDSSMSSSLSSSSSSFVLPPPRSQPLPPPALPQQAPSVNTNSLNQINTFFNNLPSPVLGYEPRQRSERILNLTCMLNGYISRPSNEDDLFSSQSTNNIALDNNAGNNNNNELITNNRDSMNKSADVLNGSARFYDLKKKVYVNISANITPRKAESLPHQKQTPTKAINNISNQNTIIRADSLEDNSNIMIQSTINAQIETTEKIEMNNSQAIEATSKSDNNTDNLMVPVKAFTDEEVTTQVELGPIQIEDMNKDGSYYLKLLDENTDVLNSLCQKYQKYTDQSNTEFYVTIEDSLGEIQTAIGKAQLLINQKFKQFRGLCVKNLSDKSNDLALKEGEFVTLDADLAGFWDMVCLQIEDIHRLFLKLDDMKANNWEIIRKPLVKTKTENQKPNNDCNNTNNTKKNSTYVVASKKNSDAARQRLIEAKKRAAALKLKNQNKDIEIFE